MLVSEYLLPMGQNIFCFLAVFLKMNKELHGSVKGAALQPKTEECFKFVCRI